MSFLHHAFTNTLCMLGRHTPKRGKVTWDGRRYVGHCKHCGQPLHRITHKVWRADRGEAEFAAKARNNRDHQRR